MMDLKEYIKRIISEQSNNTALLPMYEYLPVDVVLRNGNIILKSFKLIALEGQTIKGLTRQEEYSAPREGRSPVYCFLEISEIKDLTCPYLEIDFALQKSNK